MLEKKYNNTEIFLQSTGCYLLLSYVCSQHMMQLLLIAADRTLASRKKLWVLGIEKYYECLVEAATLTTSPPFTDMLSKI